MKIIPNTLRPLSYYFCPPSFLTDDKGTSQEAAVGAADLRIEVAVAVEASCRDRARDIPRRHRRVVVRIQAEAGEEGAWKADKSLRVGCYT